MTDCGCCHECGTKLRLSFDGSDWCGWCMTFRRYRCHGWRGKYADGSLCPGYESKRDRRARLDAEDAAIEEQVLNEGHRGGK